MFACSPPGPIPQRPNMRLPETTTDTKYETTERERARDKLDRKKRVEEAQAQQRTFDLQAQKVEEQIKFIQSSNNSDKRKRKFNRDARFELAVSRHAIRLEPLGEDRFFARYFWHPENGACVFVQTPLGGEEEEEETGTSPRKRRRIDSDSTSTDSLYSNALPNGKPNSSSTTSSTTSSSGRSSVDEVTKRPWSRPQVDYNPHADPQIECHWSFYDQPKQIDELIDFMNEKGNRESALKFSLNIRYKSICSAMRKRDKAASLVKMSRRRSSRAATVKSSFDSGFTGYRNSLRLD
eukprot:244782_1